MAQLRQDYAEFVKRDAEVVVVGPEGVEEFRSYWEQNILPFRGIPDPTHAILKLYGQQFRLLKLGRMPGQVVIDQEGLIRFVHYATNMADITDNREILDVLERINAEMESVMPG